MHASERRKRIAGARILIEISYKTHLSAKRVKEIRDLTFTSMKPERSIEPMMSMMVPKTNKLMASMIDLYGMRTFGFSN